MKLLAPKHTLSSVLQELAHGLENDTVVLDAPPDRMVLLYDQYTAIQNLFGIVFWVLICLDIAMVALAGLYSVDSAILTGIALSFCFISLFLYAAWVNRYRRRYLPEISLDEVTPFLVSVDIEILSQIMAPPQASQARHSQQDACKQQALLVVQHLRHMKRNAVLLRWVGYSRIHSSNPHVAAQAQELIGTGVHVQLYSSIALAVLFFYRIFKLYTLPVFKLYPLHRLIFSNLIGSYETLKSSATSFPA